MITMVAPFANLPDFKVPMLHDVLIPYTISVEHAYEIRIWLKNNCVAGYYGNINPTNLYQFEYDSDALHFALRWNGP
jgi:hypothetical protein